MTGIIVYMSPHAIRRYGVGEQCPFGFLILKETCSSLSTFGFLILKETCSSLSSFRNRVILALSKSSKSGHGGLFSKTRNCVRCLGIRRYPRRPEGHRGICPIDSLGPFSESAPAALLGSFFSVRAGNVSFLKRDPHGRANVHRNI